MNSFRKHMWTNDFYRITRENHSLRARLIVSNEVEETTKRNTFNVIIGEQMREDIDE